MKTNVAVSLGRRTAARYALACPIEVRFKSVDGNYSSIQGQTQYINSLGCSCILVTPLPQNLKNVQIELTIGQQHISQTGIVVWTNSSKGHSCGIKFNTQASTTASALLTAIADQGLPSMQDRRSNDRRTETLAIDGSDKRKEGRRFADLMDQFAESDDVIEGPKVKTFLRSKSTSHTDETIRGRREWIGELTKSPLKHVADFTEDLSQFVGKIENPIGVAHTPLGIAGPLRVNGDFARGTFFIPMATTEGALVTSYTLGAHIITRSGGANVTVLKDELRVAPMFVFRSLAESRAFVAWIKKHTTRLKELAEETSHHLTLTKTSTIVDGRRVILNFHYDTSDAMGMNMACKATESAALFIAASVKPQEYWLRSNFNSNKKVSANNFINGYGKTASADVTIPRRLISMLNTTPEDMAQYFYRTLLADTHACQIGGNGHFANGITAIYIACGQDVATVTNSHVGISTCEVTKSGDLYFSAYLTNLLLGTVGGGTHFGTARECLSMMDCLGTGKAKKFAEIVTATALAGEIGICASVVNGTYVTAHETYGRNHPKP